MAVKYDQKQGEKPHKEKQYELQNLRGKKTIQEQTKNLLITILTR